MQPGQADGIPGLMAAIVVAVCPPPDSAIKGPVAFMKTPQAESSLPPLTDAADVPEGLGHAPTGRYRRHPFSAQPLILYCSDGLGWSG